MRVIAVITAPAHPCARGFSASLHVTEPELIARILAHRDAGVNSPPLVAPGHRLRSGCIK